MRLAVVSVGKGRDRLLAELSERYLGRLERFASVQAMHVPEAEGDRRAAAGARREEARRLDEALARWSKSRPVVRIALDERGELVPTAQLAGWLRAWRDGGTPAVAFVVGGDEGLDDAFREGSDRALALSRMTFTHEMARVLLLEQLYRAFAILAGHPYHRE